MEAGKNLSLYFMGVLAVALAFALVFPVFIEPVNAQAQSTSYVTVNPTKPNSILYTTAGSNETISFEAQWSYGEHSGKAIANATVTVQVNNSKNNTISTLSFNTTAGLFSFNYSSSTADILTFTPTKLVTQDGEEWTTDLLDSRTTIYGFESTSVVVWWDTFHVSLINHDTNTLGVTAVSVNVTYLLLPEDGLTMPEWATYSHQTFLPKIVHDATVTINGVNAKETAAGLYTANVSTWLPTSYIHVAVSQEGFVTTHTGFSFSHNANNPSWITATVIGSAFTLAVTAFFFVLIRKSKDSLLPLKKGYAVLGGVLIAVISVVSLYWGLVGLDSSLHGFDWALLTALCLFSFGLGLSAAILSIRRKYQEIVIIAVIAPMFTNLIGVKSALDMYQLANPWVMLLVPLVLSIAGTILICNADEVFIKNAKNPTKLSANA